MPQPPHISVIIPAFNEEEAIGHVLDEIPPSVAQVVVVDNGSTDATAAVAQAHGAAVVAEPTRGYGQACLAGIAILESTDIVVFLDGDYSDYPEEMPLLTEPIVNGEVDLVIGSRVLGQRERGALLPQARFGNWLSTRLIRLFFGVSFTDLGPFRAIRYDALLRLKMADRDFGWTVEMQVKAARLSLRCAEVPVRYRKRIGVSKISGTLMGSLRAGHKILLTIFRYLRYRE
jgi:glycosyltransferase involved in cell wall biosynthesis